MRAKRSKKYRKLMHHYETTFGFREPYQVLVDSHFLQAVYSFKMDIIPALERTLQGKAKPFITKCSLAAITAACSTHSASSSASHQSRPQRRPPQLPPPTILPLRYCSHNEEDTPIDEASCLLSLFSPSPGSKKNKQHYILATADPLEPKDDGKQKSAKPHTRYNLRRDTRLIPGVPIIYVKRSVMILEPMSGSSEGVRDGIERGKFKTGLISTTTTKRKRDDDENVEPKSKPAKKIKGANPLSMKKPKKRDLAAGIQKKREEPTKDVLPEPRIDRSANADSEETAPVKAKRKRKHKPKSLSDGQEKPGDSIAVEA